MGFQERIPLLIASIFGCKDVVNYIVKSSCVDVNRSCGSDGATALHCAATGGSSHSVEVVKILLDASADTNSIDANGNRPVDLTASACCAIAAVAGNEIEGLEQQVDSAPRAWKDGNEKKDYPYDLSLPDIKSGIHGTNEFRMYTFKVQSCSRAYSHDWTECPFVHPGENARSRDPRKYLYSCVPCLEIRKGSCKQGYNCEYSHGIFESLLHLAQNRTRLCKDETDCTRRVSFFAHKQEELRLLYASTVIKPSTSTSPLTPPRTSSIAGGMWPNQSSIIPPTLQLPNRLKAAQSARGKDLNIQMLSLERQHRHQQQQQQLIDEISSELNRYRGVKPNNLKDIFGSLDTTRPPLRGFSLETASAQLQSQIGVQMCSNINQKLHASYPMNLASSLIMTSPSFGVEPSGITPTSILSSKWTTGVIKRPTINRHSGYSTPISPVGVLPHNLSDWCY
ncbi:zinc finger CCCH domain-containing protein 66-like isoform X2 [Hibiscus syriacus]|uniref:Zinc finger CCCH domain-containing protein 66-like isoform X2 n=1 Tax=Hibiscus syriacus TaxID=106335 RepID=A0A6A2ZS55_HIBSY|nr:zinc finger CCCH domain-containing protein 66-like isoform X2 [Hibiscus syriacus]